MPLDTGATFWQVTTCVLTPDSRPFDPEKFIKRLLSQIDTLVRFLIYFVSYSLGRGSGAERIPDSSDDDKLSQVGPEVI